MDAVTLKSTVARDMLARVGGNIRAYRQAMGLTLGSLAERAGLSKSFLSLIERAHRTPSFEALIAIAETLETPVAELFRDRDQSRFSAVPYGGLLKFAQRAHLSRHQVERLVRVGRAMFEFGEETRPDRPAPRGLRCSVPGCTAPHLAKGLCPAHYRAKLRRERVEQSLR